MKKTKAKPKAQAAKPKTAAHAKSKKTAPNGAKAKAKPAMRLDEKLLSLPHTGLIKIGEGFKKMAHPGDLANMVGQAVLARAEKFRLGLMSKKSDSIKKKKR